MIYNFILVKITIRISIKKIYYTKFLRTEASFNTESILFT